jgi:hypothetical protein
MCPDCTPIGTTRMADQPVPNNRAYREQNAEYVRDLRPGDRFIWCDRPVTLSRTFRQATRRPGRRLIVAEDNGTVHRLHYYDDERVHIDRSGSDES